MYQNEDLMTILRLLCILSHTQVSTLLLLLLLSGTALLLAHSRLPLQCVTAVCALSCNIHLAIKVDDNFRPLSVMFHEPVSHMDFGTSHI